MTQINADGANIIQKPVVTSVSGTDKVFLNQSDAVKQATVDTLVNGSSLNTKVGLLENLTTEVKTSIVNAINWVSSKVSEIGTKLGTTDISTIGDGTVTGAIETVKTANDSMLNTAIKVTINTTTTATTVDVDPTAKILYFEIYNTSGQSFESISLPIGLAKYRAKTSGSQMFFIAHGNATVQFSIFISTPGTYTISIACQNSAVSAGYGIAAWQVK